MGEKNVFLISSLAVVKIVLCALAGVAVSRHFGNPSGSVKIIGFISVRIFLPCLLFSNLVYSMSWRDLGRYFWAPLLACVPMGVGYLFTWAAAPLLETEWHGLLKLACCFQNGLTFSLSIVVNIHGVPWLDEAAVERAKTYIFLYNIVCSIGLWSIGERLVQSAKREQHEKEQAREEEEQRRQHADVATPPAPVESQEEEERRLALEEGWKSAVTEFKAPLTVSQQLQSYRPLDRHRQQPSPIQLPIGTVAMEAEVAASDQQCWGWAREVASKLKHSLTYVSSPPVAVSLIAIVISLTPPLRFLALSIPGEIVVGGLAHVGAGAIPLQLLLLGCNVAGAHTAGGSGGPSREGVSLRFVLACAGLRLVIIPSFFFFVLHLLHSVHAVPEDKAFLLSMLLGSCAPSAINSSVICSMYDYKTMPYTRMLFAMYVASIATTSLWLVLYLWYLG